MKMEAFDRLYFKRNYRQRYTVSSITSVRGPLSIQAKSVDPEQTAPIGKQTTFVAIGALRVN